MVRKPSISVIRTLQISSDIRGLPYLKVHCRLVRAAILKSEGVLAVLSRKLKHSERNFPRFDAQIKSKSICFSLRGYSAVDLEFLK